MSLPLSEAELRAHLARLLREAHVTWTDSNNVVCVTAADASVVIARWITQQQEQDTAS